MVYAFIIETLNHSCYGIYQRIFKYLKAFSTNKILNGILSLILTWNEIRMEWKHKFYLLSHYTDSTVQTTNI